MLIPLSYAKTLTVTLKVSGRTRSVIECHRNMTGASYSKLRSYGAAMKMIGSEARQETGRWLNNRAENSHQPFRRQERAMIKFRSVKSLQKFVSVYSSIHNHFNHERHLNNRKDFVLKREAAVAEWRQLAE